MHIPQVCNDGRWSFGRLSFVPFGRVKLFLPACEVKTGWQIGTDDIIAILLIVINHYYRK